MPEISVSFSSARCVLAALRQDPVTESIPVIFLTAKVDRSDLRQGMELGADDYLTKPFFLLPPAFLLIKFSLWSPPAA